MKNKYIAVYALMLLSVIVTGVFLAFMPDEVPMHYNTSGEIDRMGSKYENLIFPLFTFIMGGFFLLMRRYCQKKNEVSGEKVIFWSAISVLVLFNVMFGYFLWKAAVFVPGTDGVELTGSIGKIAIIGLGAVLLVTGNILPKARMNALIGLRTVWSMKNDRVWQKSQRIAGITLALFGLGMILVGLFVKGTACIITMLILLLLAVVISIVASAFIAKADKAANSDEK